MFFEQMDLGSYKYFQLWASINAICSCSHITHLLAMPIPPLPSDIFSVETHTHAQAYSLSQDWTFFCVSTLSWYYYELSVQSLKNYYLK